MDFPFTVTDGGIPKDSAVKLISALQPLVGKRVILSLKEAPKPGRPNKRKYYFAAIVRPVCQALREAGNVMDEEATHTFLKREVGKLKKAIILPTGEVKYTLKSYRELSPREESDYITACVVWCAEMGIEIEPPLTESQPINSNLPQTHGGGDGRPD